MSAHTPGPWRYLRAGYGSKRADFDIVNADGGRVASTPYEDKARLIAAAPDLLDALRGLLDLQAQRDKLDGRKFVDVRIGTARAAIAKATS